MGRAAGPRGGYAPQGLPSIPTTPLSRSGNHATCHARMRSRTAVPGYSHQPPSRAPCTGRSPGLEPSKRSPIRPSSWRRPSPASSPESRSPWTEAPSLRVRTWSRSIGGERLDSLRRPPPNGKRARPRAPSISRPSTVQDDDTTLVGRDNRGADFFPLSCVE